MGRRWWPLDCTPTQKSRYAQDSSWILDDLITTCGENGLKGEFQFAYLAFVIGQVIVRRLTGRIYEGVGREAALTIIP